MTIDTNSVLQHQETYVIRTYEIDQRKTATPTALVKLMQEAAMQHALRLKLSVWDMEAQGITWVLARKRVHFERLPMLGERLEVITYPAGFEKFFTYRDYRVLDYNGRQIAWSSSCWLLMDSHSRRMTRIPDSILAFGDQMPALSQCLPRPREKAPRFARADWSKNYTVNYFDLDFNQHLNNTLYLQWMLESLPHETLSGGNPRALDIYYRAEARHQERLRAETQALEEKGHYLHRLLRRDDEKELALGYSVFDE
jgi:medium-chain acyl-[acyl-carrier-protein] hydrolase